MSIGAAICIGKLCWSGATVIGAAVSDQPLEKLKDVFDAISSGEEAVKKLSGPEKSSIKKALKKAKRTLDKAYEESLRVHHSPEFKVTVDSAMSSLSIIFDKCVPSGLDLVRLHHDPQAVANWIADSATQNGLDVFAEGEGRKILVALVVLAFKALDEDPSFMAALSRWNWNEAFSKFSRIDSGIDQIRRDQAEVVKKIDEIALGLDQRRFRLKRHEPLRRWELKQPGSLWSGAIAPDGLSIAAASDDGAFTLWKASETAAFEIVQGPGPKEENEATFLDFSPDSQLIAVCWRDGTIECRYVESPEIVVSRFDHGSPVATVRFSKDGRTLASSGRDGAVVLWDVYSGDDRGRRIQVGKKWQTINCVEFLRNKDAILVGNADDGEISEWSLRDMSKTVWSVLHEGGVGSAYASSDERYVVSVGVGDKRVVISDVDHLQPVFSFDAGSEHKDFIMMANFSPDDLRIVTASEDKTAVVWDASDGSMIRKLRHPKPIMTAVFDKSGHRILTSCYNGCLYLWDL